MTALRAFLSGHRSFAALLIVAALAMKALVPAGYMIAQGARVVTVEICADSQGGHVFKQIVLPGGDKPSGNPGEHGKADGTCAFSALAHASLGGVDPALLALALLFILALGFLPLGAKTPARIAHLRPPLRGPPALA